jgi:hypothetical protein
MTDLKVPTRARFPKRRDQVLRITCADCSLRPCRCLDEHHLLDEGANLIERAAAGQASQAELAAWAERNRQRADERNELRRGSKLLRRAIGKGPARALRALVGAGHVAGLGSDEAIQRELRLDMMNVSLADIATARAYVARCWLRPNAAAKRRAPWAPRRPHRVARKGVAR